MPKQMIFGQEAQASLIKGIDVLANAVKATLGPRGRNVLISRSYGAPNVTKDGVTVAKDIDLPDAFENMGARMIREAASKTHDVAGDGTTTATVIAQRLVRSGFRYITSGANPMRLKRGLEKGLAKAISAIAGAAKKVQLKTASKLPTSSPPMKSNALTPDARKSGPIISSVPATCSPANWPT